MSMLAHVRSFLYSWSASCTTRQLTSGFLALDMVKFDNLVLNREQGALDPAISRSIKSVGACGQIGPVNRYKCTQKL